VTDDCPRLLKKTHIHYVNEIKLKHAFKNDKQNRVQHLHRRKRD